MRLHLPELLPPATERGCAVVHVSDGPYRTNLNEYDDSLTMEELPAVPASTITDDYSRSASFVVSLPPSNTRYVHLIRDPFEIIVSAYRFHMIGDECSWMLMCVAVRAANSTSNGLFLAADFLLEAPIPQMTRLYTATLRSPHVYTMRLERLAASYDAVSAEVLSFLGLQIGTAAFDRALASLQEQDTSRWSAARLQQNRHVDPGHLAAHIASKLELMRMLRAREEYCRKIAAYAFDLGYITSRVALDVMCAAR